MNTTSNESCETKNGSFSWNELITNDTAAAGEFYGQLFEWQTEPFAPQGEKAPENAYLLFKRSADGVPVAGMVKPMNADAPTHWIPYITVGDIEDSVSKASGLGAAIMVPIMPVPEVGRIAVLKDPAGASFGLHELPKKG